jgi:hypothetical protein
MTDAPAHVDLTALRSAAEAAAAAMTKRGRSWRVGRGAGEARIFVMEGRHEVARLAVPPRNQVYAEHIASLSPPVVLALLDELEEARRRLADGEPT